MSGQFEGRVALVTGATSGIGAATAKLFAARGATVYLAARSMEAGKDMATEIKGHFLRLDVSNHDNWIEVVDTIVEKTGKLDVLVNSAGTVGDVMNGSVDQTTMDELQRVFAINVGGSFLGCREAMRVMLKAGKGSIVNLSSVGGYYPTTQSVAYGITKAAVTQMTKTVALFGAQNGNKVRCNSVHPGRTATPMLDTLINERAKRSEGAVSVEAAKAVGMRIPLGPEASAEDIAMMIAFLASDESAYITGAEFLVDGGWRLIR